MKIRSELLNTFSNTPSHLSSKRIERFAVFSTMLLATAVWLGISMFKCQLGATDLILVVSVWLGYAGFNTVQLKRDGTTNSAQQVQDAKST